MRLLAAFAAGVIAGCGLSSAFACEDDAECDDGVCQPEGWCSFPDGDCPSGQRFGEHSGDGLSRTCVDADGTTGAQDDAATTQDPTDGETTSGIHGDDDGETTLALDDTGESDGSGSLDGATTGNDDADSTGPVIEPPDPIAWYSFDDPQDMFADVSGNAHHGFCVPDFNECPMPVAGIIGIAVEFAGAIEHGHVEPAPWLDTTTELTLAVWVLAGPMGSPYESIVAKRLGTAGNSWSIGLANMGTSVEAHIESTNESGFALGDFPVDDEWHHVASVWDGMEVRVYVDGMLTGSGPASAIEFDDNYVSIGAGISAEGDANFFGGTLDEFRIYDVAVSDEVVAVLATTP